MAPQYTRASRGISVRVLWGNRCIHSEFLAKPRAAPYRVGRHPSCELALPLPASHAQSWPLIQWEDSQPYVQMPASARLEPLDNDTPRTVALGPFEVQLARAATPRPVDNSPWQQLDYLWLNSLLGCALLFAGTVLSFDTHVDGFAEDAAGRPSAQIQRWVRPAPVETRNRTVALKSTAAVGPVKRHGQVTPVSGQRAGRVGASTRGTQPTAALTSILGEIARVGRGSNEGLFNSLGAVRQASAGGGLEGVGLRGAGFGGISGNSIGIGGLRDLPKGYGSGLYLCGPGKEGRGCKKGTQIVIDPTTPEVSCSTTLSSCLDKELIRGAIRKAKASIRACYEYALTTRPTLEGVMRTRFTFGTDGTVTQADTTENQLDDPAMTQCVLNRLRAIRFPKTVGSGEYTIHYPFLFRR